MNVHSYLYIFLILFKTSNDIIEYHKTHMSSI